MRSSIQPVTVDETVLWQVDVARRWGLDRVTIYRMDREGKLPPPDLVLGRRRGRYISTIEKFERESAGMAQAS